MRPAILFADSPNAEEISASIMIIFYFLHKYMLIEGKIENLIVIATCEGLGIWSFPYKLMARFIPMMGKLVAGRSRGTYVVSAMKTFSVLYKAISYFLPA